MLITIASKILFVVRQIVLRFFVLILLLVILCVISSEEAASDIVYIIQTLFECFFDIA